MFEHVLAERSRGLNRDALALALALGGAQLACLEASATPPQPEVRGTPSAVAAGPATALYCVELPVVAPR